MTIKDIAMYYNGVAFVFVGIILIIVIIKVLDWTILRELPIFRLINGFKLNKKKTTSKDENGEDKITTETTKVPATKTERIIATVIFVALLFCVTFLMTIAATFK